MPSRAGADGLGAFSFYDHLYLPESEKDLVWEYAGRRLRTHLVFRLGGKRKTLEAYLLEQVPASSSDADGPLRWAPLRLADGTVSDGKVDTYERCLEAILGSAQTFFTSVFSAQGKRQFCALRNAEVKTLLADLLGLEEIRVQGQRAMDTVRLLKAGLTAVRQERSNLAQMRDDQRHKIHKLSNAPARVTTCLSAKDAAAARLATAQVQYASLIHERDAAGATQIRRQDLDAERAEAVRLEANAVQTQTNALQREGQRIQHIDARVNERRDQAAQRLAALSTRIAQWRSLCDLAPSVHHAVQRMPLAKKAAESRALRLDQVQLQVTALSELQNLQWQLTQRIASIEREAGQATLRVQDLTQRLALTAQVPCSGTDLQGRCSLLADAHQAHVLKPSAEAVVSQLAADRTALIDQLRQAQTAADKLKHAPSRFHVADTRLNRATQRVQRLTNLSDRLLEVQRAQEELAVLEQEREPLQHAAVAPTEQEAYDRAQALLAQQRIQADGLQRLETHRALLKRIDQRLASLPAPFDLSRLQRAGQEADNASTASAQATAAYTQAVSDAGSLLTATVEARRLDGRLDNLDSHLLRIEAEISTWTLLGRCLSNDGLIALAIDDAGPSLATHANGLLQSCYGPRFTISIKTIVQTAKGEDREGFDIVVYDADTGLSKSVTQMSGGERTWINEAMTRAVALYLAQNAGRRYTTLFCDEADGALDPQRKRMFMSMKREVLRAGNYEREYFISQTPELAALADAVIDVERLADPKFGARPAGPIKPAT